jgi:hypothetical protein
MEVEVQIYPLINLGIRWWVFNAKPQLFYPRKNPVHIVQETGWANRAGLGGNLKNIWGSHL